LPLVDRLRQGRSPESEQIMHAIQLHTFGPAENLSYDCLPDPAPAKCQVTISVEAAGVHLLDTIIRRGGEGGPFPLPDLPMVPGREVAGTVDAVGADVDRRWLGRRVVAHLGAASGGYAEQALAPVDALHEVSDLGPEVAVAMIGTGRTTLGILEIAELQPDDVVLVTAAAGGIGNLLVQAARRAGATVVGLAGSVAKVDQVRRLGADIAVDYTQSYWHEVVVEALHGRAITVALDGVGGEVGRKALEQLAPGGRLVLFGWSSGRPTELSSRDLLARGLRVDAALGPRMLQRPGGLRELETKALQAARSEELRPLVGEPFPLAEAAAAHRALENRATVGKTVLVP
jgi:NADPH2:quinone reductase